MFGYFEVFAIALVLILLGQDLVAVMWVGYAAVFGASVPPGAEYGPSMVGAMFLVLIVRRFWKAGKVADV